MKRRLLPRLGDRAESEVIRSLHRDNEKRKILFCGSVGVVVGWHISDVN